MIALLLAVAPASAVEIPFEQYQLDNGLNVILHVDHSLPRVVVNTWYGVGSKDEVPGRSGFAHLFEHLMFMGTTRLPGSGFDELMEAHGGWNNAWTSEDNTDYFDVGPSNLLDLFLWMEADRMDGLGRAMTQEKLDLQLDVVRNERRQSDEDTPYGVIWLEFNAAMYPADHPYGHPVIGSHEDLQAASVEDVKAFFSTWYAPNNASLVVAGDFEPDRAKAEIERLFGSLPASAIPERTPPAAVDRPVKPLQQFTDQVQIPKTVMAWHTAPALQPGDAEMDVVGSVLGGGRSSRLYQQLVHERGIALEIDAMQYSQQFGSIFLVDAMPAEGHDLAELEAAVQAEIDRLAADGPTDAELERVRNQLEVGFISGLEALQDRAMSLNRYRYLTGDPGFVQKDLDRYHSVDAEAVKKAAALLSADRRAIIRVLPESSESGEASQGGAQ